MLLVLPYPLKRVSLKVEHGWLAKYIHQFELHQLLERGHLPWTGLNISDISCPCHLHMQLLLEASEHVRTVFEKKDQQYSGRCSEENKRTLSEDSEVQLGSKLLKKHCRHTVSKSGVVTFTMKRTKLSFTCCASESSVRFCHSDHSVFGNSHCFILLPW